MNENCVAAQPGIPAWALSSPLMLEYYLTEWGVPVEGDDALFERLSLEAFQCGLSWALILRRRLQLREAFHGFRIATVAEMDESDVARLMDHSGIIRNRAKISATINNAKAAIRLREQDDSLTTVIARFMPEATYAPNSPEEIPSFDEHSTAMSKELKKRGFKFVGPTTCFALMEAIGMHDTHCVDSPRRGCSGLWNRDGTKKSAPAK